MPKRTTGIDSAEMDGMTAYGGPNGNLPLGYHTLEGKAIRDNGVPRLGTQRSEEQEIAILCMISMPEEYQSVRYSDQFSTEKTVTKNLKQREQASWQQQPAVLSDNNLPPTEEFIVSFRGSGSIWRRFLLHDPNFENNLTTYTLYDSESPALAQVWPDQGGDINWNIAQTTSSYKPHGPLFVGGRTTTGFAQSRFLDWSWMWLDGVPAISAGGLASTIAVTFQSSGQIVNRCIFWIYAFQGGKCVGGPGSTSPSIEFTAALSPPTNFATITNSDYYAIFYQEFPATAASYGNFAPGSPGVTITFTSGCSVLRHIQVQDAYANISQLGPGCVRAASLRLTDMAAPLNIQGETAVANVRELRTWWDMYNAGQGGSGSPFKQVVNYRDAYLGPLRLGGYSFHLPSTMEQFASKPFSTFEPSNNSVIDVWWDIGDQSVVNVYSARSINTGANDGLTGQGCDCWVTVATCLDWTTDNKWPEAKFVDVSYDTWMDALQHMRFVPRAMSNKWHGITMMGELFRQGKIAAKKYGGAAIRVMGGALARHLIGGDLTDRGTKLLSEAYGVGNEIIDKLKGGGM